MSAKNLVIVESPAKSKTISKYLGPDFTIKASMGHIRDLPGKKSELTPTQQKLPYASLAINTDKDFEPLYVVTPTKKKVVKELKSLIDEDTVVWLAADEDRE
ncbi:MAG: toprim domain-containing protein [Patescibacteria group bacterium]|nr:toprim domain-containing protein [Patescibacteria group bacterium]